MELIFLDIHYIRLKAWFPLQALPVHHTAPLVGYVKGQGICWQKIHLFSLNIKSDNGKVCGQAGGTWHSPNTGAMLGVTYTQSLCEARCPVSINMSKAGVLGTTMKRFAAQWFYHHTYMHIAWLHVCYALWVNNVLSTTEFIMSDPHNKALS